MKSKNIEDIYPLSPVQQGMLFHSLLAPASGVYVVQVSYEVHGHLDTAAFEQAWQQEVDRHPVLRTAFVWENLEKPLQVVGRHVKAPLEQHDWRTLSPEKQQQQLEALLQAERHRGFNLSKAPLMRLTLIQMSQDAYQFIWSYHHLLLDGWSVPLLLKEFLTFYNAFCQGQNLHLEKLRPYRDYIAWLQQQDLSKTEEFWRQTLKGFTAPTPLGVDRMPNQKGSRDDELGVGSSQDQNYEEQQIQISPEITLGLQSLAKKYQLTLNTLVQGAWAVLLSRYSSEDDVVFGATCSGRPVALAGAEYMVGLFVNTLPVRVKVNAEQSLLSWLRHLQAQQVELRQYEYSPLVEIHRMSDVPRSLPLFESLVVFENYPVEPSLQQSVETLDIRNVRTVERTNYPLTVFAVVSSKLSLKISYDCHRFAPATITQMLGHFQTLLEGMVNNSNQRLWELPLLMASERHQLLVEWNNTQSEHLKKQSIHDLFERMFEKL